MSGHCSIPFLNEYLNNIVPGGIEGMMEHNHNLVIAGRQLICDALGIDVPAPDDMIASIATIPLPAHPHGTDVFEPDPLQRKLLERFGIELPVWTWDSPSGRFCRISAQVYNHIEQYEYLAHALVELLDEEGR